MSPSATSAGAAAPTHPPGGPGSTLPPVVQVTAYYPPEGGGIENVAQALAEHLAEHTTVQVLTMTSGRSESTSLRGGRLVVIRSRARRVANVRLSLGLLWRLLRVPRGAVYHAHVGLLVVPELTWLAARIRRRPFVAHFHMRVGPTSRLGRALLAPYDRWVTGRVLRSADRVVALTEEQRGELAQAYAVEPTRVLVVPNGVSSPVRRPDAPRRRDPSRPLRLLYVGRLSRQKNIPRLVRTLALLAEDDVEAVVVGSGEDQGVLREALAGGALPHVRWVGTQRGRELSDWYDWADALVMTSDAEGMPLVLLEAMMAGLPVVATDIEGVRRTADSAALLAPPDAAALAAGVRRLATEPHTYDALAAASWERGAAYSWESQIPRLTGLYAALAAERAGRTRRSWGARRA